MEALRALTEAGIPTSVLMAPILPGLSDDPSQLRAVVEAALEAGAVSVSPIMLHLRPGVREEFMPWLEATYPDLAPRYRTIYERPYGPKHERDRLVTLVRSMVGNRGLRSPASRRFDSPASSTHQATTQLALW